MNQVRRLWIWLTRVHRSLGFGIQSPTDYGFVRSVVNEHWPYYAYNEIDESNWQRRKLGRLYFRLANWRKPKCMCDNPYSKWFIAGSHNINLVEEINRVELERVVICDHDRIKTLLEKCDQESILVVEDIYIDWDRWRRIVNDERVGTTFDLYYCGIVFFDTQRFKHNYVINF